MTQNTDGRDGDSRYAWAATASTQPMPGQAPSAAPYGASADTRTPAAPPPSFPTSSPHAYSGPAGTHPGAAGTPSTGTQPAGPGSFPPPPPAGPGDGGRSRRSPGWPGVLGVGVASAALASLLTAGLVSATDDDVTPTASTSTSQQSEQTAPGPVTSSNSDSPDWLAVANAVEPSVVAVQVSAQGGSGEGSGVILDKEGQILTNNHVVAGAGSGTVKVDLADGRGYDAQVVGTDPSTDLAVIKIQNPPSDLKPATLGSSSAVKVGEHVMAVGNPLGLAGTVTTGIVSAVDRPVTTQAQETNDPFGQSQGDATTVITNAIQTDAAVNPGNSGGALVDAQGRVIGINSSIASLGSGIGGQSGSIGLGFAIPIDEAKYVAEQLADGGQVAHAWLGVLPEDGTVTVDGAERQAAVLNEVVSGSPAEKAGLKTGDAVIGVNGDRVNSGISLVGQIRERRPSDEVTIQVVRDGKTVDINATLATNPNQN